MSRYAPGYTGPQTASAPMSSPRGGVKTGGTTGGPLVKPLPRFAEERNKVRSRSEKRR